MATSYKWGMQFVNINAVIPREINISDNPNDTEWADRLEDLTWLHESPRITGYPISGTLNFYRLILRKTWTVTQKRTTMNDRVTTYVQDAHVLPADLNDKRTDEFGNDRKCFISDHKYSQFGYDGFELEERTWVSFDVRRNQYVRHFGKQRKHIPFSRRPEVPKRYRKELSEHPTAWQFSDRSEQLANFTARESRAFRGEEYCMLKSCFHEAFRNHPVINNPVWTICFNEECPETRVHAHCPNFQHKHISFGKEVPNIMYFGDMGIFDSKDSFEYSIALNRKKKLSEQKAS